MPSTGLLSHTGKIQSLGCPVRRLSLLSTLLLCAACPGSESSGAPRISLFVADPGTVTSGAQAILRWQVEGADTVSIDPGLGDVSATNEIAVRPTRTTTYTLRAKNAAGETSATTEIAVKAGSSAGLATLLLVLPNEAAAGQAVQLQITARDTAGNTLTTYGGTVHFSSTDTAAQLPSDATFTSGDSGTKSLLVTFGAQGTKTVRGEDRAASVQAESNAVVVGPGAPTACTIANVPGTIAGGAGFNARVKLTDASGAAATSYRGTMTITATDAAATLPAGYAYLAADASTHDFLVRFGTQGAQTITATDSAQPSLKCTASTQVTAPTAAKFVFSAVPASATPATPITFTLTAADAAGAAVTTYRGTVAFTSTGTNATLPAPYTFAATDNGVHAFTATLNDPGAQTITATDAAIFSTGTSSAITVHGLAYTDPAAGTAKVRLVKNAAASSATTLALDLVAAAALPAVYGAALNLPVDATRVALNATTPIASGALDPGSAPAASKATLPTTGPLAGVVVAALSQKAAGTGAKATDTALAAGQVLFTIKIDLKTGGAVGVAFDGAALGTRYRATVRDRQGHEVVAQSEFAVGKLEVQ